MPGVGIFGFEPGDAAGLVEDLRRRQRAAADDRVQRWGERFDQGGDFGFQFVDLGGQLSLLAGQGAGQPGHHSVHVGQVLGIRGMAPAKPKVRFAIGSKIREPDYLPLSA